MDNQYLSFAHEQEQLDWGSVLCSRFGIVQGLNILVTVTKSGLLNVSISDGLWREHEYKRMLNDIVLPHLTKNKDLIFVQESNVFTTSEIIRDWFAAHPDVKCVTWPFNSGITPPLSLPWAKMKNFIKDNFSLSRRRLIRDFLESLEKTPNYFKESFTTMKETMKKVKDEHVDFVREHFQLDWNQTLFARFGEVRCVNVLVTTTQSGYPEISISDGLMSEERYLQILNDVVLPFMAKNKDTIYVQESSEITTSSRVSSWFKMHPHIRFITWPPIISPNSQAWENMTEFVDANFPITGNEIKALISEFFVTMKKQNPRYGIDSFNRMKACFDNINRNVSVD